MTTTANEIDYDTGYEFESIHGEHFRGDTMLTIFEAFKIAHDHAQPLGEFRDRFGASDSIDMIDLYIWLGY